MRILAIDCGLTKANPTGLAVVDTDEMQLRYGLAIMPTQKAGSTTVPWHERVWQIAQRVSFEIASWHPDALAWELAPDVEHEDEETGEKRSNSQTLIKLSHIGGMVIGLAALHQLDCQPVYPSQAKVALTKNSQASKADMIRAARVIFSQELIKDIADACGVALAGEALLRRRLLTRG